MHTLHLLKVIKKYSMHKLCLKTSKLEKIVLEEKCYINVMENINKYPDRRKM